MPKLIFSKPAYYNMACYERKPCGDGKGSVWCSYGLGAWLFFFFAADVGGLHH